MHALFFSESQLLNIYLHQGSAQGGKILLNMKILSIVSKEKIRETSKTLRRKVRQKFL